MTQISRGLVRGVPLMRRAPLTPSSFQVISVAVKFEYSDHFTAPGGLTTSTDFTRPRPARGALPWGSLCRHPFGQAEAVRTRSTSRFRTGDRTISGAERDSGESLKVFLM